MMDAPNARGQSDKGGVEYKRVGDHLKIRYEPETNGTWLNFSAANLKVELNGQPLTTCQEVTVTIKNGWPTATLRLDLETVDIDAYTMTRLEAFLKIKEASAGA